MRRSCSTSAVRTRPRPSKTSATVTRPVRSSRVCSSALSSAVYVYPNFPTFHARHQDYDEKEKKKRNTLPKPKRRTKHFQRPTPANPSKQPSSPQTNTSFSPTGQRSARKVAAAAAKVLADRHRRRRPGQHGHRPVRRHPHRRRPRLLRLPVPAAEPAKGIDFACLIISILREEKATKMEKHSTNNSLKSYLVIMQRVVLGKCGGERLYAYAEARNGEGEVDKCKARKAFARGSERKQAGEICIHRVLIFIINVQLAGEGVAASESGRYRILHQTMSYFTLHPPAPKKKKDTFFFEPTPLEERKIGATSETAIVGMHADVCKMLPPSDSRSIIFFKHSSALPVEITRISASRRRLALGLLLRLIRLIRLVSSMRGCWRGRVLRRRSATLRHLWVLWRVDATWALKRHALHLRAQIAPLLRRGLLSVRVVAAYCGGHARVATVDGRFVAACGKLLRVA